MLKAVSKKIFGVVSDGLAQRLERRADAEGRSLSSLVAYLLERQMEGWVEPVQTQPDIETPPSYKNLGQCVMHNLTKLVDSGKFLNGRLKELMSGAAPTEVEILRIALICGLTEEYVSSLPLNGGANAKSKSRTQ